MIEHCRVCGGRVQKELDLGDQAFTGIFPKERGFDTGGGPLVLVRCMAECGLTQLGHNFELAKLYGDDYGYRSGLNRSMVDHLRSKASRLSRHLLPGDVALDIGSNDGTFLSFLPDDCVRVGMDPTARKFAPYYKPDVRIVPEFFSAASFADASRERPAKLVTSIACFYDLPDPLSFARGVHDILEHDGLWHIEQSYLPSMLMAGSYDTICHEHIEYYGMRQIAFIAEATGFQIVEARKNDVNGGSFEVTLQKGPPEHCADALEMLVRENWVESPDVWHGFARRVERSRESLLGALERLRASGEKVVGLGASTKGNVILQYCGIGPELVACIGEVNSSKFGCFTPGTNIPIVPEHEALALAKVALVLPWHFRKAMRERHSSAMLTGTKLLFPLPFVEVVIQ